MDDCSDQEIRLILRLNEDQYLRSIDHLKIKPNTLGTNELWCGNLLGAYPYPQVKGAVWTELHLLDIGHTHSCIVVEGLRNTLSNIGVYTLLQTILGSFDQADIVRYKTQDQRLRWYETYPQYLQTRADVAELRWHLSNKTQYETLCINRLNTLLNTSK